MEKAKIVRDFSKVFKNLDGDPLTVGITPQTATKAIAIAMAKVPEDDREGVEKAIRAIMSAPLTLGSAAATALTQPLKSDGDAIVQGQEASRRNALALKVYAGGEIAITPDERDLFKTRIAAAYAGSLVSGQAFDILEGADVPAAEEKRD